jgi:hypothetical protein
MYLNRYGENNDHNTRDFALFVVYKSIKNYQSSISLSLDFETTMSRSTEVYPEGLYATSDPTPRFLLRRHSVTHRVKAQLHAPPAITSLIHPVSLSGFGFSV